MRVLFLFLVLGNVAFFAWSQHFAPSALDAQPPAPQVAPETLKIVPPPAAAAAPAVAPAKPQPAPLVQEACLEWGSFTLADTARAEKALEPLALGERLATRRTAEVAGWWVFIPPQGNRQGALRKAAELKALGVQDYFIVGEESDARWAVSLGVFRTEEAAQARLAALRAQGVRTARVAARETVVPKVWLRVSGLDAELEARLRDVAARLEGSELRSCP